MPVTTIFPTAGTVQARDRVLAILSVNTPTAVSLATEVNAASTVAIECFLRDFNPEGTEGTVDAPDRYCAGDKFPSPDKVTWAPIELNYIWRPSEISTSDNNKAFATLTKGLYINLLARPDYDKDTAFAASQYYNLYYGLLGAQIQSRSGDASDASSEWQIKQLFYPKRKPVEHQLLAA